MGIAILYQSIDPPVYDGIVKPKKDSGYADSGADIGMALVKNDIGLVTPVDDPDPINDLHWVFPDSQEGIEEALRKGATTFWLNTVLFGDHPITSYREQNLNIIGQKPGMVDVYDDKYVTSDRLRNRINIPEQVKIDLNGPLPDSLSFPQVIKPIRGRGSQGVSVVNNRTELLAAMRELKARACYGDQVYLEEFLPGREITVTVLPPGSYILDNRRILKDSHWCLPLVERIGHEKGIAPYSGKTPVSENSYILPEGDLSLETSNTIMDSCVLIATEMEARAPIRIDGRADEKGDFYLFDYNLKPNMTGASRPHRKDQNSLTAIAASEIGWSYEDLIRNLALQSWSF